MDDIQVDAVKIGMLANAELIVVLVEVIERYKLKNIVLDTVLVSSSGKPLLESAAVEVMVKELFPRVDLITPNIPEVNTLLGTHYTGNKDEIEAMASALFALGANAVLIKGGHSKDTKKATDYFVQRSLEVLSYSTSRLITTHTHGTGCVLSSAIATYLALGKSLKTSVELSKIFLYKRLEASSSLKFKYIKEEDGKKEPMF